MLIVLILVGFGAASEFKNRNESELWSEFQHSEIARRPEFRNPEPEFKIVLTNSIHLAVVKYNFKVF